MSTQGKKPAEQLARKVKNINLLPNVFDTEPNRKMLDSTLDLMTSKGQLVPFKETYGTRNAANRLEEFFKVETNEARRESQANTAFVLRDENDEYLGKASYYDIENYFNVKNLPLRDGVVLDHNISVLDLPVDYNKLADYKLYYWLQDDLPSCRIHLSTAKFSIVSDLLGKPFASLTDDITGRSLELQNGMVLYFTGEIDSEYKTNSDASLDNVVLEDPKLYFVYGVGSSIQLVEKRSIELRTPTTGLTKRPWDEYSLTLEYIESSWDGAIWDGSRIGSGEPEYVTQEKYTGNANHWQSLDHWYHISTIRSVARFLDIAVEEFIDTSNKARRPIICFNHKVKLYNWPTGTIQEVASYLPGSIADYQGSSVVTDRFGYEVKNGDRVVFSNTNGVYSVSGIGTSAVFTLVSSSTAGDGAIITSPTSAEYYTLVYKNNLWQFAQNKIEKNQTPRFEFYLSDGTSIESLNDVDFTGGVILGFKDGTTYDTVLEKSIEISNIEFDVVSGDGLGAVNPNQIKFFTDVDGEFKYFDSATNEEVTVRGPYGYKAAGSVVPFYKPRLGLDFTRQVQDLIYQSREDSAWNAEYIPTTNGFTTLHIYHDDVNGYKFYYDLEGYGLVKFTTKTQDQTNEQLMPLISGSVYRVVCHDLPDTITFYKSATVDNITTPTVITADYITNNGISNGTIELNLSELVQVAGNYVTNELAQADTKLYWSVGNNDYRIAYVLPINKWSFVESAYLKDLTNPLYYGYEFTSSDVTLEDGTLSFYKQLNQTDGLLEKVNDGDKICFTNVIKDPVSRTAPLALTSNPLNETLSTISYYGLYQHAVTFKASSTNIKQFLDPNLGSPSYTVGGGTLIKHNDPIAKFAVAATNLPYDIGELMIKQGKHYDSFLGKLKTELQFVVDNNSVTELSSLEVLNLALTRIYSTNGNDDLFWSHSNMLGWGRKLNNYVETSYTVTGNFSLNSGEFTPVSQLAGKETILHITHEGRLLVRGVDYDLTGNDSFDSIVFYNLTGQTVKIQQWLSGFRSLVPASLAKLGLTNVYRPEIYLDTTNSNHYLVRHDGTRYYLEEGVDNNNYPNNLVEQYLYEYELAVWSSISYNVEQNNQREVVAGLPGYFRTRNKTYQQVRQIVDNEVRQWMLENNIFVMSNTNYNAADGFTLKYQLGTGDGEYFIGSWRSLYRYFYDTDRPHTHPWEMLGYSLKPTWWDTYYSWTDSAKRAALKAALRIGKVSNPAVPSVVNPAYARTLNINAADPATLEDFPVDANGNLLSPLDFDLALQNAGIQIGLDYFDEDTNWEAGDIGPYEQVFLNTHRGLAAELRARYLAKPSVFVNQNWLPGQVYVNEWGNKLDRTTEFWQKPTINHNYHRSIVDGSTVYTSGLESLLIEFCVLDNKDYTNSVIGKFNNVLMNKEFLLGGFTNKNNVRIQSTSISSARNILFVPEENYSVRTVKHYPEREFFYSGVRIIFDGTNYSINGFANEYGYFPYYIPMAGSATVPVQVGDTVVKEKIKYTSTVGLVQYGELFNNRQEVYDFLIGYGKYLLDQGFVFEEPEAGDIRNWQLSAKQFIFWSNDNIASGNYIDLNPCADFIKIETQRAQLDNLEGTNENVGQCVDRLGRALFSKDLLVTRDDDYTVIKTKDTNRSVYGIKMTFSVYESVVHLDPISVFGDVYFSASESTSRRSFLTGGKKSQNWTGNYFVPGYVFSGTDLVPNLDTMSEVGRNLLDIENVVLDPALVEASRSQFGLTRNPELRELFLQEDNEILFKNAVTFNKGTRQVFDSLNPLTHQDGSQTVPYEEYMVRIGEFGNTKNQEYYEFELSSEDIEQDIQIIKFVDNAGTDPKIIYVEHNSDSWVYKPYNKNLAFELQTNTRSKLNRSGPVITGDTDLSIDRLEDLPTTFDKFVDLWTVPNYDAEAFYKVNDRVRYQGCVYTAQENITPASWTANESKFQESVEAYLPNIFVANYTKTNPNLSGTAASSFIPGTWQVLQTTDRCIGISEICPGPNDASKARVTTIDNHLVEPGDYVMLVGADGINSSANGIWQVESLESGSTRQFYIDTRILNIISQGKLFTFKPVRFNNSADLNLAVSNPNYGYNWQQKYQGDFSLSPSGYNPVYPIAIVDGNTGPSGSSNDYGNYTAYSVIDDIPVVVKQETSAVDLTSIDHLLVYDYNQNKTLVKVELFSPENLYVPNVFKNDIDSIGRVDPAKYNRTTDPYKSVYTSLGWYEEYVGRRWWNTSSLQFNDYITADEYAKAKYWGSTATGTLPEIYEWTKSTVHPSQWAKQVEKRAVIFGQLATGEAYVDRSLGEEQYHWVEEEDYVNGSTYTVYYFWVKNKQTIAQESKFARVYTVDQLSKVILNPSAAGLAWWSPISEDTIIIKGVKPYLTENSTVVQIKKKTQGNEKHQQWLFISEGNTVETIPEWLHVRFRDSIAGRIQYQRSADYTNFNIYQTYSQGNVVKHAEKFFICRRTTSGFFNTNDWQLLSGVEELSSSKFGFNIVKNVPDLLNLHRYNRLGNSVRPYAQSWFNNLFEARRTLILKLNELLLNVNVFGLTTWGNTELNSTALLVGDEVIDMTEFWEYADFRSEDYESTRAIAVLTDDVNDLYTVQTATGDYIRVNSDAIDYTIYRKNLDGSFSIVYQTNAAIQFKSLLYLEELSTAWDMAVWDSSVYPWDFDRNAAFKTIIDSLRREIFVSEYVKYYSLMMCAMFRYVMSEQTNVDWLAKSSTIEPVNLIAQTLSNSDTLKRDEIVALTNFYSSVKSYRDKIRGGTINKVTLEDVDVTVSENISTDDITLADFSAGGSVDIELPVTVTGNETIFDPVFVSENENVDLPIAAAGN